MNDKMLIKTTINDATDPHLFAYLARFENARLRAGALKALASAAARANLLSVGQEVGAQEAWRPPEPAQRAAPTPVMAQLRAHGSAIAPPAAAPNNVVPEQPRKALMHPAPSKDATPSDVSLDDAALDGLHLAMK